jgi:hypothetical protein
VKGLSLVPVHSGEWNGGGAFRVEARVHQLAVNPGQQHVQQIVFVTAPRLGIQISELRVLTVDKREIAVIVVKMAIAFRTCAVERLLLRDSGLRTQAYNGLGESYGRVQIAERRFDFQLQPSSSL